MRVVYNAGKDAILAGQVDMLADTFKAQMVAGYVYDPSHSTMANVSAPFGAPGLVSVASVTDGTVIVNDVTFTKVNGTGPVTGIIVYHDGLTLVDQTLLTFTDQRADSVMMSVTPNGGDITFSFDYLLKM